MRISGTEPSSVILSQTVNQQLICNLFQVDYGFALQNEHVAVSFIKKIRKLLKHVQKIPSIPQRYTLHDQADLDCSYM